MIKFFRRIRHSLLQQGKSTKYFKYAIGEVVLVVIGILIALSINNWNEGRKETVHTQLLFKKTLQELHFNIQKANKGVGIYRGKDSLYRNVINRQVSKEDYLRSGNYLFLLLSGELVLLTDESFQKLINSEQKMTEEQDSLLTNLKQLYNTSKAEVVLGDEMLPKHIFGLHEKYRTEQSWYADLFNFGIRSDEMLDYFLNSQEYFNDATYYKIAFLDQHLTSIKEFRENALKRYIELCDYLNVATDTSIAKVSSNYQHYLGVYKGDNTTLHIKDELGFLNCYLINNNDSSNIRKFELYIDSNTYFTSSRGFGKLIYDRDNKVSDLEFSTGSSMVTWKKRN